MCLTWESNLPTVGRFHFNCSEPTDELTSRSAAGLGAIKENNKNKKFFKQIRAKFKKR